MCLKIRSLTNKVRTLGWEAARRQGAPPGEEAMHHPRVMIAKDISKVLEDIAVILQFPCPPTGLKEHCGIASVPI